MNGCYRLLSYHLLGGSEMCSKHDRGFTSPSLGASFVFAEKAEGMAV